MRRKQCVLALVVGLACLAVFATWVDAGRPPRPPTPPADPAIAYAGKGDSLYVMNSDGSNVAMIWSPTEGLMFHTPSWSPDGESVVFVRTGVWEVYVIDIEVVNGVPEGSNFRTITGDCSQVRCAQPRWSPLGDEILVNMDTCYIALLPLAGGPLEVVYEPPDGNCANGDLEWSPDGSHIAFVEHTAIGWELRMLNLSTGEVEPLSVGPFLAISRISWSNLPHDRWLAIGGWLPGEAEQRIYLHNLDVPGSLQPVAYGGHPRWSPDNTAVAFLESGALKVVNLQSGAVTMIARKCGNFDWRR